MKCFIINKKIYPNFTLFSSLLRYEIVSNYSETSSNIQNMI